MFTTILCVLVCFTFLPQMRAASRVALPPEGCYPGFTTAKGCNALNSLTTGAGNTRFGWRSLFLNTTSNFNTGVGAGTLILNNGDSNTAVGAAALLLNTTGSQNVAVGTNAMVFNQLWSVRYDAVNAMLLNEFLKEHKKVEQQRASISELKSTVALQQKEMQVLTAQLKEQAPQIQKMSAQIEMAQPATKVVSNAP